MYFYSGTTGSFYHESLRSRYGDSWPSDAKEISDSEHIALRDGMAKGKIIEVVDGAPVLVDAPSPKKWVPTVVSRFQARRALKDAGVFDIVEAAIAQADEFTQDAWADAQEFRRESDLILILGQSLQLNLDELFIAAAKIEA